MYEVYENCSKLGFYDIDGNSIQQTPHSHPYSYDPYVIFKDEDYGKEDHWVYSDRLKQWDAEKFEKSIEEVSNGRSLGLFGNWKPEEIESFLIFYFGKSVKLTAVMQGCNASTGHPHWVFAYKELSEV